MAGITKHIKIYDYNLVVSNAYSSVQLGEGHCPIKDLPCPSKISSVAWNAYWKGYLVCEQFDGRVILWDFNQGTNLCEINAHDKRVWAVDFNKADSSMFVSGSDDCVLRILLITAFFLLLALLMFYTLFAQCGTYSGKKFLVRRARKLTSFFQNLDKI